jgi:isoquinoline 1-oxidoreductase beta subunit
VGRFRDLRAKLGGRGSAEAAELVGKIWSPNPWVRLGRDGTVTLVIDRSEMGQGVVTGLATLVAEELEVDLDQIRTEFAPADPVYNNRMFEEQTTGGSTSVRAGWNHLRQAGAEVRERLLQGAARHWQVPAAECGASRGCIVHGPSGRSARYAELLEQAAAVPAPKSIQLKPAGEWRLIGTRAPRLEIPDMVRGRTVYGSDVQIPGMLYATVLRCPVFGGAVARFEDGAARGVPGVKRVLTIGSGIAVVADNTWSALRARDLLQVSWREGGNADLDSAAIRERLRRAVERPGEVARTQGDVGHALGRSRRTVEALYETPYLAHAPMEPMNCTAHVGEGRCEVWAPTQAQGGARETAARVCGLPLRAVQVHTTYMGGAFGRRLEQDFVAEAVEISKAVAAPVQVLWTRADDMQHDFYRPASCVLLRAALDEAGRPMAWLQRIAGPDLALDGVDVPYRIPNVREEHVREDPGVPTGPWRSVGASQNAFAIEAFVDELAHAAGQDPLTYRLALLEHSPRHRAVLELAAHKAEWSKPPPAGRFRGIAVYRSFGSYVAQVAELSIESEGALRVHRVVCAGDCGTVVNPDAAAAQLEGGVVFGLTAALRGEIEVGRGRVLQASFRDYPLLTMSDCPAVEVHLVKSQEPPGGVGEPGVPPIAPAAANAAFAATGMRVRRLPIKLGAPA